MIHEASGAIAPELFLMLCAALVVSALGYIRTVYFVSLGYGFSMTAMAVMLMVFHFDKAPLPALLQGLLIAVYGLRLGGYLALREGKAAYKREAKDAAARSEGIGFGKKFSIWIGVALLYVIMASPLMYNLRSLLDGRIPITPLAWAGVIIMLLGLGMESLADQQKSRYKSANPDRFCDTGLYRLVRCPNYLGEMLFWLGNFIAGAAVISGWLPWAMALIGWVCISLIMIGSAKRLEARQENRYGDRDDFKHWCSTTPVLFPLIPLYSLKNVKVYLE